MTVSWNGRVGLINAVQNPIRFLLERAAYLREAGEIIGIIHQDREIDESNIREAVAADTTFYVRGFNVDQPRSGGHSISVEIGKIMKKITRAKVSFSDKGVRLRAIDMGNEIIIGKAIESRTRKLLKIRKGNARAFFHPSVMNAPLARAMCNLAQVMPGQIMLDPFCGGGGILCEGAQLGASVIGVDMNWRLLQGAKKNLWQIGNRSGVLVQADARSLPISHVDAVVTDPPYGQTSSTRGDRADHLVDRLLDELEGVMTVGGKLCICSEKKMAIGNIIHNKGLTEDICISVRIHKKMIREIRVISY
ncbi:MAG: RsmD family RNA methyltransferase [Candidatus Thorarchaeota archaeon]|nr:RsmD family RNA methyltransferase [Candidatus Thorarchaeota archaeon]